VNLILFGPPGAGKGTQAGSLCAEFGLVQVATGDIFRKNLKQNTELGQLARSFMDKGQLVPDEVVWKLVEDRLSDDDVQGGVLFDGFPRTVRQSELLVEWAQGAGWDLTGVVALEVADDELVRRLSGRRTCLDCGATYHVDHNPPSTEGACDRCSGKVVQRSDDTVDTVKARLATYHEQTAPVLAFFESKGLASRVDGVGAIDEVAGRIRTALG
jgi:adenylate kinase